MKTILIVGSAILSALAIAYHAILMRENHKRYHSLECAYRRIEADYEALLTIRTDLIRQNEELTKSRAHWEHLAVTDTLTEIANSRAFHARLGEEVSRAQRHGYPLTVLMLDIDGFKPYNDTFGHLAGDEVLKEVAAILRETMREGDLVARYGGDEFIALLPQTEAVAARLVAQRICDVVASQQSWSHVVTLSIGAAEYPMDGLDARTLASSADSALYSAKKRGRNQVVLAQEVEEGS